MPQFERKGTTNEPLVARFPRVIGGQCEFCGVMDNLQPPEVQYQLCPHFKGLGELRCSYCPETANPTEVIQQREIKVSASPTNPNELIAWCDSYNCSQAHLKRFKRNA